MLIEITVFISLQGKYQCKIIVYLRARDLEIHIHSNCNLLCAKDNRRQYFARSGNFHVCSIARGQSLRQKVNVHCFYVNPATKHHDCWI